MTLALAAAVALIAVWEFAGLSGTARRARGPALAAALAFAGVLALGVAAPQRLGPWRRRSLGVRRRRRGRGDRARRRPQPRPLGRGGRHRSRRRPRRARRGRHPPRQARPGARDPSLVVGYRLRETGGFVDDAGRPVEVPAPASGRSADPNRGRWRAHRGARARRALLADPNLVESVGGSGAIAVTNAHLQAERALAPRSSPRLAAGSSKPVTRSGAGSRRSWPAALSIGSTASPRCSPTLGRMPPTDGGWIAALEADLDSPRQELREFARRPPGWRLTDARPDARAGAAGGAVADPRSRCADSSDGAPASRRRSTSSAPGARQCDQARNKLTRGRSTPALAAGASRLDRR